METKNPLSPKSILLALALGSVPAFVALSMDSVLQSWDLGLSAVVLFAALLLAFGKLVPMFQAREIRLPMVVAVVIALVPTGFLAWKFDAPVTNDERAYLFQAELFADGELTAPLPPSRASTWALHQRQILDIPPGKNEAGEFSAGKRLAKYPPGTSIALVPGTWLGIPWLSVAFMAVADLFLLLAIARCLGIANPLLGPLLLAASPFFLLVHTSFQSEVFTLPAALGGWWCLLRMRQGTSSKKLAVGVGAAAGWIFLCRPLTGLVFAAAAVLGLRGRLFGAVLGGLPFLALYLAYNAAQTGDLFLAPYELYAQNFGPWDAQDEPMDVYGKGDFWQGIVRQWGRWSVTQLGMLGGIGLGVWGLFRHRNLDGGFGIAFIILLPLAYAFHWYPGHWGYLGPLYGFETLGVLVIGSLLLLQSAPPIWRKSILLAAISWGPLLFVMRVPALAEQAMFRSAPQRAAAQAETGSLVLLPWVEQAGIREKGLKLHTPSKPPFENQRVVIIRQGPNPETTERAIQELGLIARKRYIFEFDGTLSGNLRPIQ
jgi:hypothetical protein